MNATAALDTETSARSAQSQFGQPALPDPIPIATGLLGLQLAIYVGRWIAVDPHTLSSSPLTAALNVSLLVAGISQIGAGVLSLFRGRPYLGYVATTFGLWLLGFYWLATGTGVDPEAFTWYLGTLIIPLVILMVPAVLRRRWPFILAFGAIVVLLVLDAVAFHLLHNQLANVAATKSVPDLSTTVSLLRASGWTAAVAALTLFWITTRGVFEATGLARAQASID